MANPLIPALATALFFCGAGQVGAEVYSFRTLAGIASESGDTDGPIASARFTDATGVAVARDGTIYVTETSAHVIRRITPNGIVSTFCGRRGVAGAADGSSAVARFNGPARPIVSADGVLFVADTGNHTIRHITPDGTVTTLVGQAGMEGSDDGAGPAARFREIGGIAVAPNTDLFVADLGNATIRKVTRTGVVTTLAGRAGIRGFANGTGANARFTAPEGIAVDAASNLFVTDARIPSIRRVTPAGVVTTFVGSVVNQDYIDGVGRNVSFMHPLGACLDGNGNIYVVENVEHTIRRVSPEGVTITVAGNRAPGEADGEGPDARFTYPSNLAIDAEGNLYVATGRTIRKGVRREPSALVNLSVRCVAGPGADVPIIGYAARNYPALLIRGVGPSLTSFGVAAAMANPSLQMYRGADFLFEIDDWDDSPLLSAIAERFGAFPLVRGSRDAAFVSSIGSGETLLLTGGSGVALMEVYDVGRSAYAQLTNLSGRARVGTGEDILIAGFAIAGSHPRTVLIRGIGPSLTALGVPDALANPRLQLYAGTTLLEENDDWGGSAALRAAFAVVAAFPLEAGSRDAALMVTLPPGSYSAHVSGVNNTTGVALVELYDVP